MSAYRLFGNVEKLSVATGASDNSAITNPSMPVTLAVIGDVAFHAVVAGGTPNATDADMYYPADQQHIFFLDAGQVLSVRGVGTGSVWV